MMEAEVARQTATAIVCDTCDGRAGSGCYDCQKRLCPKCRHIHDHFAGASFHSFTPLNQGIMADKRSAKPTSSREKRGQRTLCKMHSQEAGRVCRQCDMAVCPQCQETSHRGHATEDLPVVMEQMRDEMRGLLQKVLNKVQVVDQVVEERNKEVQELKRQEEEMVRQTVEAAGKVTAWANQAENNAVTQINAISEPIKTKLVQQKNAALERKNTLNQLRDRARFIMQSGSFVDLKSLRQQMEASLSAQPHSDDCQPKADGGATHILFQRHSSGQEILQTTVPRFVGEVTSFAADGKQKEHQGSQSAWGFEETDNNFVSVTSCATAHGLAVFTRTGVYKLFTPGHKISGNRRLPIHFPDCATTLPSSDLLVLCQGTLYVGSDMDNLVRGNLPGSTWLNAHTFLSHESMPDGRHAYTCIWKHAGVYEIEELAFTPPAIVTVQPVFQIVCRNNNVSAFDVSSDAKYFAVFGFINLTGVQLTDTILNYGVAQVSIFQRGKAEPCAVFHSPKRPLEESMMTGDVCFSQYNGKEMLRVAVNQDDTVYILDFRNDCAIVGKTPLLRPMHVRADAAGRIWVVCQGHVVAFNSTQ